MCVLRGFSRRLCPDQLHPHRQSMFFKVTGKLTYGKGKVSGEGGGYCHQTCSALPACSRSLLFRWAGVERSLNPGARGGPTDGGTSSGLPSLLCLGCVDAYPSSALNYSGGVPTVIQYPFSATPTHNVIMITALTGPIRFNSLHHLFFSYWTEIALWPGPDYSGPKVCR